MTLELTTKKRYMLRKNKDFIFPKKKEQLYRKIFRYLFIFVFIPFFFFLALFYQKRHNKPSTFVTVGKDNLNKKFIIKMRSNNKCIRIPQRKDVINPVHINISKDNVIFTRH